MAAVDGIVSFLTFNVERDTMTDKKEISVNESLAGVNKILRSAGDLILPRETNIALSILADVACQQQEEIDELRERVQSQLPSDTSDVPERRTDKNLLIVLDALGCAPVLDVLGREPICNDTIKYARNLFLHIESKVKDLIKENETLRNAEKCKSQNLPMTIEHSIELNGTTTINSPAIEVISHLIKDGSIPLGEKCKEDRQDMIRSIHESLNIDSMSQGYDNQECKAEGIYSFGNENLVANKDFIKSGVCKFFERKYYVNGAHAGAIYYGVSSWGMSGHKNEATLKKLLSDAISSF